VSPCLSKINVHSHHAQEQEEVSKIEKYDTALITKLPQAQDHCDTSDNSNNNLLSLPDSDNDDSDDDSNNNLTSKSNLSDQNHVYDRVSDTFKGDIEDTSAHGDGNNTDSSGDNDYIAYNPGGISTSSIFSDATQASTTSDDTTDDSSPSLTHAPSPFDNDAADDHHSDDAGDHGRDTVLGITDGSLDLIKSDNSRIVYDPGGIGFSKHSALGGINDGDSSSLPYDPGGGIHFDNGLGSDLGNTTISNDARSFNSSRCKFVYNPGGDGSNSTTKADSAHEGNDDPGGDTNHKHDEHDFVYNPSGNLFANNTTISTVHDADLVPPLELAQVKCLDFNALLPSSAAIHPSLPSANLLPQSDEDADAVPQPNIQDVATTAATSKQSELGLTRDSQFLKPPRRCKEHTHAGLGMGSALSSRCLTFA